MLARLIGSPATAAATRAIVLVAAAIFRRRRRSRRSADLPFAALTCTEPLR
jgi:hypothetical protein